MSVETHLLYVVHGPIMAALLVSYILHSRTLESYLAVPIAESFEELFMVAGRTLLVPGRT